MKTTKLTNIKKRLTTAGMILASTVFGTAGGGCEGGATEMALSGDSLSAADFTGFGTGASSGIPVQR